MTTAQCFYTFSNEEERTFWTVLVFAKMTKNSLKGRASCSFKVFSTTQNEWKKIYFLRHIHRHSENDDVIQYFADRRVCVISAPVWR